jgi:hypothetical protein
MIFLLFKILKVFQTFQSNIFCFNSIRNFVMELHLNVKYIYGYILILQFLGFEITFN